MEILNFTIQLLFNCANDVICRSLSKQDIKIVFMESGDRIVAENYIHKSYLISAVETIPFFFCCYVHGSHSVYYIVYFISF